MMKLIINLEIFKKHQEFVEILLDKNLAFKEKDGPYRFKVNRKKSTLNMKT